MKNDAILQQLGPRHVIVADWTDPSSVSPPHTHPHKIVLCIFSEEIFMIDIKKTSQELRMLSSVTISNKDCHESRSSIVSIVISVSNHLSQMSQVEKS